MQTGFLLGGYLVEFSQQGVQAGQLSAQVDVAVKPGGVVQPVWVGDLLQEALHAAPLALHKVVHKQHVLLLSAKPAGAAQVNRWDSLFLTPIPISRL